MGGNGIVSESINASQLLYLYKTRLSIKCYLQRGVQKNSFKMGITNYFYLCIPNVMINYETNTKNKYCNVTSIERENLAYLVIAVAEQTCFQIVIS